MEHDEEVQDYTYIFLFGWVVACAILTTIIILACTIGLGATRACADTEHIYLISPTVVIEETYPLSGNVVRITHVKLLRDFPTLTKKCVLLRGDTQAFCRVSGSDTDLSSVIRATRSYSERSETEVMNDERTPKIHGNSRSIYSDRRR